MHPPDVSDKIGPVRTGVQSRRRDLYGGGRTEIRCRGPRGAGGPTGGVAVTGLAVRTFLTMLVVIDPIGLVPMFLALAGDRDAAEQRRIALRAVLVAAGILVSFGLGRAWLMGWLGISLAAFRVAGGVLLFRIAVQMVFASYERETKAEMVASRLRQDVSVFPPAIPTNAGPGAIASLLNLTGESKGYQLG